jgi:hypothetical protein
MLKKTLSPTLIILYSLITRLFFALYTEWGDDSIRLYQQALKLYEHHQISPVGAQVVYSGTALPGALTQLLIGVPLFFSHGSPAGPAYWIGALNFISSLLTYRFYRILFPKINSSLMAAFILFAPWSLLFTPIWNPSFLPLIGIFFLMSIYCLIQGKKIFTSSALACFCIIACLQLHLSFILLILIAIISLITGALGTLTQGQIKKGVAGGFLGAAIASITLIPYLLWITSDQSSSSTGADFLIKNIEFSFSKILNYPTYFFRFLSFPSFEVNRFVARGSGMNGFQLFMKNNLSLGILQMGLEAISVFMIGFSLRFYIHPKAIQLLKKIKETGNLKTCSPEEHIFFLHWATPLLSGLLFVFSIKNPSAQTYWVLMPMSFYPLIYLWNERQKKQSELLLALGMILLSLLSIQIYLASDPFTIKKAQTQVQKTTLYQSNPTLIGSS